MAMTRQERIGLHTNQKRIQASKSMPAISEVVEGKPMFRETHKGLYQYVKFRGEVYSTLLTKHTRTLEEEINDTVNNITISNLTVTDPIDVADGGTGLTNITDHSVLVGSGTGDITPISVGSDGQILVGSTGADPVFATLTCDDGLSATTGAGTLEIDLDLKSNGGIVIESNEAAVDLGASSITGTLAVGDGGTGQTSVTNFKNVLDDETWTFANAVTANAGVSIDNITIDGTEIDLSTGDLTFDVAGDIILDAAGDQIYLKDNTSTRFTFNLDSTPEIDVTGAFTIDGSSTITLDAATNIIGITGGRTVIKADTGGHIYFHDFDGTFTGGTALFNDYKINNLADNYHFVTGLADYKQNYALIAEEFSSAAYNLDFHK